MSVFSWKIWAVAGVGAIAAAQWLDRDVAVSPAAPSPSSSAGDSHPGKAAAPRLIESLRRESIPTDTQGQLFAGQSWKPVVRAPAAAAAAPAVPPSFPYRYAGRLQHGAGALIYLARGSDLLAARVGDVLDATWKIDGVAEDHIEVTFVPDGRRQSLALEGLAGQADTPAHSPRQAQLPSAEPRMAAVPVRVPGQSEVRSQPGFAGGFMPPVGGTSAPTALANAPQSKPSAAPPGARLGAETATPSGRLGSDAPSAGSMPIGSAPTGSSMQAGPTPTGKLGL